MKVAIVVMVEVDDSLIDPTSPAGVTQRGREMINQALGNLGSNVSIRRLNGVACNHPNTYVDGEYLRCSDCGTIVGSSGQGR